MKKEELEKQGWVKQTTYDELRLNEIVETYDEMGFEVRLESFDPDNETGCSECMKLQPGKYKTVYTREKRRHEDNG
ncbi:hypothetical protein ACFLRB_04620 [Acidobacteriota bacterium]